MVIASLRAGRHRHANHHLLLAHVAHRLKALRASSGRRQLARKCAECLCTQHVFPLGPDQERRRPRLKGVLDTVETAKRTFGERLSRLATAGGLTPDTYHRYLSMQYHLTKQVQRHFILCASHHSLMTRKRLRDFLVQFANEEEPHYLIAEQDLREMGLAPLHCPPDVALWHSYFLSRVTDRPFHRLGATAVLENLGAGAGATGRGLLAQSPFLNDRNTRFLDIHFHEVLPHGDQIIGALLTEDLTDDEVDDAQRGAMLGTVFYFRLVEWVFRTDPILVLFPDVEITVPDRLWVD